MTGYQKLNFDYADKNITIEIKSLNSKYIDISTRIPSVYKEKELAFRELIRKHLQRGKIDFNIYVDMFNGSNSNEINKEIFLSYYNQLKDIEKETGIPMDNNVMKVITSFPDILKQEREEIEEEEWEIIMNKTDQALKNLSEYRTDEGRSLHDDIISSNRKILSLLDQVTPLEEKRIENIKSRIKHSLEKLNDKAEYDPNRFEQELIFYLEKFDINEEKVRLRNHCSYFAETIEKHEFPGKKLGFISQEMGREINTLGSKANDVDMQQIVVQMKEELDKIKEQVLNIV